MTEGRRGPFTQLEPGGLLRARRNVRGEWKHCGAGISGWKGSKGRREVDGSPCGWGRGPRQATLRRGRARAEARRWRMLQGKVKPLGL